MAEANSQPAKSSKIRNFIRTVKYWRSVLPGTARDYFLLSLAAIDVFFLLFVNSYKEFIHKDIPGYVLAFDLFVIFLWAIEVWIKVRQKKDIKKYLRTNWYELIGIIPLYFLRPFLLLRGVKLAIAFYRFGTSGQNVSEVLTREITFRFRDVIVDTIADAVFLHSLERVEEVMLRLDYSQLAKEAISKHNDQLNSKVNESLQSKFLLEELSKIPFMSQISHKLGEDIGRMIAEVLETEVIGDIMKDITANILKEMAEHVKKLPLERITEPKEEVPSPPSIPET
ncbi:hypothetical protein [Leptospira licerasiae]|uniref:Ion transporter n=1 Tax=Leptospira licerasiae str. MMD4847 TaxID=1049971 RepID=A0ABP2RGG6_9LEPT|nr:hypothetical protein [Leptospira licerasiae]EID99916.1 hypothetical protein LEP1GSC185_2870 [Leptospira licerasiae serovar Varillal str. VAR 010]EJZ41999.1 hypothetical protein LEP1GSC178_0644 [Leptospira licerasiae str. MMD4847]